MSGHSPHQLLLPATVPGCGGHVDGDGGAGGAAGLLHVEGGGVGQRVLLGLHRGDLGLQYRKIYLTYIPIMLPAIKCECFNNDTDIDSIKRHIF